MKLRPRKFEGGFSLLEAMAVLTISAVLMTLAMPSISKTSERVRLDKATSDMHSIWRAERRYRLENGSFTASLQTLEDQGYIRDSFRLATNPYEYSVTVGKRSEVTIEAKRSGNSNWFGILRITELGELTGDIRSKDGHLLTP